MSKIFKLIFLSYLIINVVSISFADEKFFNKGLELFQKKNMKTQNLCLNEV